MDDTVSLCLFTRNSVLLVLTGDLKQEDVIDWVFLPRMIWKHHVICATYLVEIKASRIQIEFVFMKGIQQGIKKFTIAKPPVAITHRLQCRKIRERNSGLSAYRMQSDCSKRTTAFIS